MPSKQQKHIVHLIHCRQQALIIRMGPFQAINYETATDVIEDNNF